MVASPNDDGTAKVVGVGYISSKGIKNGIISDINEAQQAIYDAILDAENKSRTCVEKVYINTSGSKLISELVTSEISLGSKAISESEINKVIEKSVYKLSATDGNVIHCIPTGYSVDGEESVKDPRGMFGEKLAIELHVVKNSAGSIKNIEAVMKNNNLNINKKVASPYASALSCLVDDEKEIGSIVVDMGGGTTDIAVVQRGNIIHTASIPVGGTHVTNDIAWGLTTSITNAERLKTIEGCAFPSPKDNEETIAVHPVGEEDDMNIKYLPRAELINIIAPRIRETLEMVHDHLESTGMYKMASNRIVLTGGASQLQGIREVAGIILGRQVRLGRAQNLEGPANIINDPAFATCAGLVKYAMTDKEAVTTSEQQSLSRLENREATTWGRVKQWLIQNF